MLKENNLTTDLTTDETELTTDELKEISAWLLAALHVALEKPRNAEWLEELHKKQAKKWKRLS